MPAIVEGWRKRVLVLHASVVVAVVVYAFPALHSLRFAIFLRLVMASIVTLILIDLVAWIMLRDAQAYQARLPRQQE